MDKLVINNTEYNIPNELTLIKWGEIVDGMGDNTDNHLLISLALDIPHEYAKQIPDETLEILIVLVVLLLNPEEALYNKTLHKGKKINFQELTLGQFIDLEVYFALGVGKHIVNICNILYNTELPDTTTINDVHKTYLAYITYKTMLMKSYSGLFEIEDVLDDESKDQIQRDIMDTPRTWYNIVMSLCDGDILKMDDVVSLKVIECFNWMAWNKDKQRQEIEAIKKQNRIR